MSGVQQQQPYNSNFRPVAASPGRKASDAAKDDGESIMVNSTKADFLEQSNDFIRHLPNASWIAIDEEMTGIQLPDGEFKRLSKDDSPADRYPSLKAVPERYAIIQLGICLFEHRASKQTEQYDEASFHVRRYKFTLFPPDDPKITREITLNPSSIHFLLQNNMDLNLWAQEGIPFCTGEKAEKLMEKFIQRHEQVDSPAGPTPTKYRQKVVLTKEQDKEFHARVMSSLREWLDAPIPGAGAPGGEGVSFLLPRCNGFLRRSLYEAIEQDYPYLVLEKHNNDQIRVWRLTAEEKERRNHRLLVEGYNKLIQEKIGAQRIFLALTKACNGQSIFNRAEQALLAANANEAMADFTQGRCICDRKIPLVVHNGLMDLLFLMTHFYSPKLPDEWIDCKNLIHSHFPVIYDTKIMATDYCSEDNYSGRTRLDDIFNKAVANHPHWKNRIFNLNGQSQQEEQSHDAAYDAYMTGVAFCALSYSIHDQYKFPVIQMNSQYSLMDNNADDCIWKDFYGRNKLYFHLSPYTIDLESPESDPLGRGMSHQSTFRVANIDPSVSSRDIVNCLSGLVDSNNQRVNFDVIWVDDTTFLVGAQIVSLQQESDERFKEHGGLLLEALKTRFNRTETVTPLLSVVKKPENGFWNLWGFLGDKSQNDSSEEESRPQKRRRVS
eukprot:CAMPEP_0116148296 /NCGR_PEP_ID=MMETSP0329-20121206/18278_1 /TAXON_ID=697910 /ORGANISM="Pseudo-nitzschia arenysensis, Strain B593" /LENGTH=664 /DNA_ID=CAMNT_0003644413 /DNA_START=67 /DNA_END=2064 /DNA_ORIENTATION=+